ncbi:MAG: hypothetical protein RH981_18930 [Arenibacter sp.]
MQVYKSGGSAGAVIEVGSTYQSASQFDTEVSAVLPSSQTVLLETWKTGDLILVRCSFTLWWSDGQTAGDSGTISLKFPFESTVGNSPVYGHVGPNSKTDYECFGSIYNGFVTLNMRYNCHTTYLNGTVVGHFQGYVVASS